MSWLYHHLREKPAVEVVVKTLHAAARPGARRDDHNMFGYYLGHLLDYLEQADSVSEMEVVQLEWTFFQSLRFSERRTRAMNKGARQSPRVFRSAYQNGLWPGEGQWHHWKMSQRTSIRLNSQPPRLGTCCTNGRVFRDRMTLVISIGNALEDWVTQVRRDLHSSGREEIGDYRIGEVLAAARPVEGEPWPPGPVREIIDLVRSSALEEGIVLGVINRRGVTVRMPNDGGQLEREEAAKYRKFAEEIRFESARTAAVLDRIADYYDEHAKREDDGAELRDIE